MRTLRLARIAAEAEGLRLRRLAQRTAIRIVLVLGALGFMAWAAAFAHIAIWFALRVNAGLSSWASALVLFGLDLVMALILALLAARSIPGRVEAQALEVRRRAMENVATNIALSRLVVPALRTALDLLRRK